jgi:hypothetical protein
VQNEAVNLADHGEALKNRRSLGWGLPGKPVVRARIGFNTVVPDKHNRLALRAHVKQLELRVVVDKLN